MLYEFKITITEIIGYEETVMLYSNTNSKKAEFKKVIYGLDFPNGNFFRPPIKVMHDCIIKSKELGTKAF